jgi:hypothetical protein
MPKLDRYKLYEVILFDVQAILAAKRFPGEVNTTVSFA